MPVLFGYGDHMRGGVAISVLAGSSVETMPAEFLHDPQPGLRARFLPGSSAVTIQVDFGRSVAIGIVLLINTTLAGGETVRVQLNDTDPTFAAGNLLDTLRTAAAADESRGAVVCLIPSDITARYMRVLITAVTAEVLDIGSLCAMPTLRSERNEDYGGREGRLYTGASDTNPFTGAAFRAPGLGTPRFVEFSLGSIRQHEAPAFRAMFAALSASDDVVFVPETTLDQADLNRRTIYGPMGNPGEQLGLSRLNFAYSRFAFLLTERL